MLTAVIDLVSFMGLVCCDEASEALVMDMVLWLMGYGLCCVACLNDDGALSFPEPQGCKVDV
jgi:hypothetical protein